MSNIKKSNKNPQLGGNHKASEKRQFRSKSRPNRGTHRRPEQIYDFEEADNRLQDLFRHHGFGDYPHSKRRQLTEFYRILMENQKTQNFTRLVKLRDVGLKHFIDSLMVSRLHPLKFPLIDLGTGPGIPGIPLKIEHPEGRIILVEGVRKRVEYLKMVRERMGLEQLDIIGRYMDEEFAYPCQSLIARAVQGGLGRMLGLISQSVVDGGEVLLMKGPNVDDELDEALKQWKGYYDVQKDLHYELPNTPNQRRLVVLTKIKTPNIEDL